MPGTFAEYVRVPKAKLDYIIFKPSGELSNNEATMIEPLATSLHAVQLGAT